MASLLSRAAMPLPCDRRTFLRRAGAAGLLAPALPFAGCAPPDTTDRRTPRSDTLPQGPPITRPLLLPWHDGAVRIAAPLAELPLAYVSRREMRIWVDHDHRDRVYWLLRAHISVSTGVWRIPDPGDPERLFVQPGDTAREYAEYGMLDWDAGIEPAEGDFRVARGRAARARVHFTCAPVSGAEAWVSAGPLEIARCVGQGEEGCREDLVRVGTGTRQGDRACPGPGTQVDLLTWACLDR